MQLTSRLNWSHLLLALISVGLLSALAASPNRVSAQTRPVFRDGQAQVVAAFADTASWIREELWVETEFDSDGDGRRDRVHTAVVRPQQTATEGLKLPVVYSSSPYFAGVSGAREFLWDVKQELGAPPPERTHQPVPENRTTSRIASSHTGTWVPRGFAVVHSEAPGTGLSQGCPTIGGPEESLAPKAVIDWLNGRARGFTSLEGDVEVHATWSTGKVGMTGTSYNGTIPVAAASTGVEGLEAIIPVAPNTSYYRYYRSNGLVRHPGGWLGEDIDFLYDFVHSNPARREYCDATVRDGLMAVGQDRSTGDYNDFWATRDLQTELQNVRAATLMAHAFNDWNVMPEHSVRVYEMLKEQGVPTQAYYHQGGHGGPPPLEMMNRWFTRYLHGIENGVEEDPKAWIVREGDDRQDPTPYPDYPNPAAAMVTLRPQGGGSGVGGLTMGAPPTDAEETLTDDVSLSGRDLATVPSSAHRLLYATDPLTQPMHVSGTPRITVRVAADRPAVNLSVWLVALPWTDGDDPSGGVVTRGWADLQNSGSLTESTPLVPGEFVEMTFDLQPDDQIIPAGQRLGLMVFSSDADFTLWPEPGARLTVDLAGTSLELPVVGGRAVF